MTKRVTRARSKPRRSSRFLSKQENDHEEPSSLTHGRKTRRADTTMEIIDQLSQQFKKADQNVSVKEKKHLGKNVFNTSLSLNTSYRFVSLDTSFTSTPAVDGSRKSLDYYNFDEKDDDIRLRLDLSPIKGVKTPARKTRKQSKTSSNKTSSVKRVSVGSSSSASKTSNGKRLSERQPSSTAKRQKMDTLKTMNDKNARKKESTPKNLSEPKQNSADKWTSTCSSAVNSPADSGVFLTPPSLLQVPGSKGNTPSSTENTPSSTENTPGSTEITLGYTENTLGYTKTIPSFTKPTVPTKKNDKKRYKKKPLSEQNSRTRIADSPMLSPVQKVTSPSVVLQGALVTSQSELFEDIDYSLYEPPQKKISDQPQSESLTKDTKSSEEERLSVGTGGLPEVEEDMAPYKALDISRSYCSLGFGYFSKSAEKKTKKNKTKKTKKLSMSRYDLVAKQMNQEFDELESFELSMD